MFGRLGECLRRTPSLLFILASAVVAAFSAPAAAAQTEITALIVTTSKARADFISNAAMQTYLESQVNGLAATLRTYANTSLRVTGAMVVASDPKMSNVPIYLINRIRSKYSNFAGVTPRRDLVRADVVFVFAGSTEIIGECSWAINRGYDDFLAGKKPILTIADMQPQQDTAVVVVRTARNCRNLNPIHRGFGRMMGLLNERSNYSAAFYNAVPDKTLFAFRLDSSVPYGDTSVNDAMAPKDCSAICGLVYYSGRNVSAKFGILGQVTFYRDSKGGLHDGTGWLSRTAPMVSAFR